MTQIINVRQYTVRGAKLARILDAANELIDSPSVPKKRRVEIGDELAELVLRIVDDEDIRREYVAKRAAEAVQAETR